MYLIRKGELPRPICVTCNKAGDEGAKVPEGQVHICRRCIKRLESGEGLHPDLSMMPIRRAL